MSRQGRPRITHHDASGWESEPFLPGNSVFGWMKAHPLAVVGGQCAVLMQLANPAIAAAIDKNSEFQANPKARLTRTMGLNYARNNGTRGEAHDAAVTTNARHRKIPAARRLELMRWVDASQFWATMRAFEVFHPLPEEMLEQAWQESARAIWLLGLTPEGHSSRGPRPIERHATLEAHRTYVAKTVAGLNVSPTGKRLGHDVLYPSNMGVLTVLSPAMRAITARLLPGDLAEQFDVPPKEMRVTADLAKSVGRGLAKLATAAVNERISVAIMHQALQAPTPPVAGL